ncbi:SusC/RagA family TonB-linked outer membrane protein [Maribellus comscasis]|uniref:SusC/RagA family TonB-linked outer membrane protein n=1 Tax=Maribellus comscasis TaxID=2681766 RepID=A0A6I6JUP0_9BACT|nr:TonB-dependent receptor [Maribellus comscasis]QGY44778.1 SusC/RagA family TonB-linked outer membrane protein [Maribellus comscasis]
MKKNGEIKCLRQSIGSALFRKLNQQNVWYFVVFLLLSTGLHAENNFSMHTKAFNQNTEQIEKNISGKVVDRNNLPIPGVSVLLKGTTIGTVTDLEGNFSLSGVGENAIVVFSFVGMKTQEVRASGKTVFDVVMAEDAIGLDEVIAVGYGTQIKRKVTSAISTIKTDEALEGRPIVSVQQGLSGMTPGLNVSQSNGRPGNFPGLTIRGNGSPIVLVDGFQSSLGDVDPNQVAEISVLKDASAAAVYGLQAANGVILITTKDGQKNKPVEFTYGIQTSVQGYTKIPELANTVEYMQLRNKAELNEQIYINGVDPESAETYSLFSEDVISRAMNGEFFDTRWSDILYGQNASQISQNLSLRGGTDKTVYSMALGYVDQDGVNISDLDGFKRYNVRVKLQTDVNKWLTIGTNSAYSHRTQISVPIENGRGLRAVPYYPVRDHLGSGLYAVGDGGTSENPVLTSNKGSFDKSLRDAFEIQLNAKLKLFKGLSFEENVGVRIINSNGKDWTNVIDYASLEFDGQTGEYSSNPISVAQSTGRSLSYSTSRFQSITTQSLLRYNWSIDNHSVNALLGWQTEEKKSEGFNTKREDFLSDAVLSLDVGGVETGLTNNSDASESSNLSALGRINYDYKGRYLIEFSFRNDWSSNFAKGYRSGFFPSFSLGWNVKEEEFMAGIEKISLLKLRGAWGEVGLDNVSALSFIQRVNQNNGYPWSTGMEPGLVIANYASPELTWETHKKINLGVDIGLYDGKISVMADVFRNRIYDILADVQIAQEFGLPAPSVNRRSQEYKGWELIVTHKNNIGDFRYTVSLNATNVRSEWLSLGGEEPNYGSSLREEGFPVGIAYGYRADGLIASQEELDEYVSTHTFEGPNASLLYVGAPKLVDISGPDGTPDGQIDATYDREIIEDLRGNYRIGGQLGLAYKSFSFSAVVSGVLNRTIYATGGQSNQHFSGGVGNAFAVHLKSFDPDNPDREAAYPLVRSGLINYDRSSYWMRNASYLRVRNMNLSYAVNKKWFQKTRFLKKADFFVSVENPFILCDNFYASDYGWDPELGIGEVDYPLPRTFTFGANFTF